MGRPPRSRDQRGQNVYVRVSSQRQRQRGVLAAAAGRRGQLRARAAAASSPITSSAVVVHNRVWSPTLISSVRVGWNRIAWDETRAGPAAARARHSRRRLDASGLLADRHHRLSLARRLQRAERRRLDDDPDLGRRHLEPGRAHGEDRRAGLPAGDRLPQLAAQQRHLQLQRPVHRRRLRRLPARLRLLGEPLEVGDAQLRRALHARLRAGRLARVAAADAEPRAALRAEPAAGRRQRRHRQLRPRHRSGDAAASCWPARKATTGRRARCRASTTGCSRRVPASPTACLATRRCCAAAPASSTRT